MMKMSILSAFSLDLMEISGRSYACGLPKAPPIQTSGLYEWFISETPVKVWFSPKAQIKILKKYLGKYLWIIKTST